MHNGLGAEAVSSVGHVAGVSSLCRVGCGGITEDTQTPAATSATSIEAADCMGLALNLKRLEAIIKAAKQIIKICYKKLDGKMPSSWNATAISRFKRGVAICEDTVHAADKVSYACFWAVMHKKKPSGSPFVQQDVKPLEIDVEGIQYTLIQNLKNLRTYFPRLRTPTHWLSTAAIQAV